MSEKHKVRMLSGAGHDQVEFDPQVEEQVSLAEQLFDKAVSMGYAVADADAGTIVDHFDPQVREHIAIPQISGG